MTRANGTSATIPVRRFRRPIGTRLPVLQSGMLRPQAVPIRVCDHPDPAPLWKRVVGGLGVVGGISMLTLLVADQLGWLAQ